MSGRNALLPPDAIPGTQLQNQLAPQPTWADAAQNTTGNVLDWIANQRAQSAQQGLWGPDGITPAGARQAGMQTAGALAMATSAPGGLFRSEVIPWSDHYGNTSPVLVNPSPDAFNALLANAGGQKAARVLALGDDNIAIADSSKLVHRDIAQSLSDAAHPGAPNMPYEADNTANWFVRRQANGSLMVGNTADPIRNIPRDEWPGALQRAIPSQGE